MKRLLNALPILVASVVLTSPVFGDTGFAGAGNHHHMFGNFGPSGMFMGPIFMIVWIIVLVALVALILKWLGIIEGKSDTAGSGALHILEERFARGEITKKQFDTMRSQLSD